MLHPGRVEGGAPAALVVLSQLQIEALSVHSNSDVPDARPRVEPGTQPPECTVVGEHGESGETDCCTEELAALVEHALLDDLISPRQDGLRDRETQGFGCLQIDNQLESPRLLHRQVRRLRALEDLVGMSSLKSSTFLP